jgi:hypothetical protein
VQAYSNGPLMSDRSWLLAPIVMTGETSPLSLLWWHSSDGITVTRHSPIDTEAYYSSVDKTQLNELAEKITLWLRICQFYDIDG